MSALSRLYSKVGSPIRFSLSVKFFPFMDGMSLVALRCMFSGVILSFLYNGDQIRDEDAQYFCRGL